MTFKRTCDVERKDQYIIEFDENVLDEEWMQKFRETFYDFNSLEEHADHIAQFRARNGTQFIEGYGVPLVNGKAPRGYDKEHINEAINIIDGDASMLVYSY
ncbi:hypothetical protein M3573_18860 [Bacillus safensis]|uniref:hypothetical protein n=1 Tax=Bacillus safensis TaxID=561879 RepID=UPI00203A68E3|nr:hypothetical protein [Bacillus safensis]MCM3140339.1 hypothetical protein [Bacillus safensis]